MSGSTSLRAYKTPSRLPFADTDLYIGTFIIFVVIIMPSPPSSFPYFFSRKLKGILRFSFFLKTGSRISSGYQTLLPFLSC